MVKNLCQGARKDATDFMIRVDSSVSNLAKDWKGQLMEAELQSLQYEVSLNGVREEIWHILDSEIARHGQLTLHQMYKVVKRYETYVAHNKCLEGKSASPHIGHQRAVAQTSGYKPRFHKTTAFTASVEGSPDPTLSEQGTSLQEADDHLEGEPTQEEDEGLHIPSFLEEASPKQVSSRDGQSLSAQLSNISGSPSKVKGVPYLNLDPYCQFIGPKNWGKALINNELVTCLLDNGSQLNFITTAYTRKWGMDIMSLDTLTQEVGGKIPPILGIGSIMVDPEGLVMMNVKIPCVKGYNEDQIAIVMNDPGMKNCPVILGMPTIF